MGKRAAESCGPSDGISETIMVRKANRKRSPSVSKRIELSVVIANWNTRELLRELLRSYATHRPRTPNEVIVVDNGSTDGSGEMLRKDFPWVVRIENPTNTGYARANNQGFASARGSFVLLLGSDTVVLDRSFDRMVEILRASPAVGAVACRLLNPDGSPQQSCRRFPRVRDAVLTYLSLHRFAGRYNLDRFDYSKTQAVEQPAATCLLIRKSVIQSIGLFDERYTILYNDVDFCKRIHDAGWTILYSADAEIRHYGSQSTKRAGPALRLEMYRNILLYYRLHAGRWSELILRPILTVRLIAATRSLLGLRLLIPQSRTVAL
jgi:GT2 family glycosyltransferase